MDPRHLFDNRQTEAWPCGLRFGPIAATYKTDPLSRWATMLVQRGGYWRAKVVIAAKQARVCWAVLSRGEDLHRPA